MTVNVVVVLLVKVREETVTSAAVDMQVQIKLSACLDVQIKTMEYYVRYDDDRR